MFSGEIIQAETRKIVAMSWVGVGIPARKMRDCNANDGPIPAHPMNFLHGGYDVVQVLDDVVGMALIELVVRKRPGPVVQIMDNVRVGGRHEIDIDGVVLLLLAASENQP